MTIRYMFKEPLTIKGGTRASAQKIGEELADITRKAGGRLTPKAVVNAAENPRSRLHKLFEWDNARAAAAYRLDQAREIIRCIRVEQSDGEPVRGYVSINEKGTSYRTISEVLSSHDLQTLVLKQADRDLDAWQRRYAELEEICEVVRQARERIAERLSKRKARMGDEGHAQA
jgi:hypothetical protein